MYADLKGYVPENVEFVLPDYVKEIFPEELDFTKIEGAKIKNANDAIKFIGKEFVATFPTGETVMRKLDEFEIRNIREEYCVMQENEVPKRKLNLEETLEEIKAMKKRAEQAYDSILAEVAKYAAEVKAGTREVQLSSKETFCIALAGYYAIYTYDKNKKVFVLAKGYLAQLSYYDLTAIKLEMVKSNSTGADYDEKSLKEEYERSGFYDKLTTTTLRVLKPKSGVPRKGVLVFTRFIEEADNLVEKLKIKNIRAAIVTGETPKKEREDILVDFKAGRIKVVANVGTLTTGFDYPALDTIILGRPTKSLSLYYQMVGRAIRPFNGKDGWVIDLGGSYRRFGAVSDLRIECPPPAHKDGLSHREAGS